MAFKASKTRSIKKTPIAEGRILIPSAPAREWYETQLKGMIDLMAGDYLAEIEGVFGTKGVRQHFAMDAKLPVDRIASMFERLAKRWMPKIAKWSQKTAEQMALKINKHSFVTVGESLRTMGIKEPADISKSDFDLRMESFIAQNVALIKSVPTEMHSKIERAVWNSLTAPKGTEQGIFGIKAAVQDVTSSEFSRAKFIAQDQNAKLYSALNIARQEQNGVMSFIWMHSSAGKTPRKCHQAWDGRRFATKGGQNELYEILPDGTLKKYEVGQDGAREADLGKPGFPPKCRCRAKPYIDLD